MKSVPQDSDAVKSPSHILDDPRVIILRAFIIHGAGLGIVIVARSAGVPIGTAYELVELLIALGLVRKSRTRHGARGRPTEALYWQHEKERALRRSLFKSESIHAKSEAVRTPHHNRPAQPRRIEDSPEASESIHASRLTHSVSYSRTREEKEETEKRKRVSSQCSKQGDCMYVPKYIHTSEFKEGESNRILSFIKERHIPGNVGEGVNASILRNWVRREKVTLENFIAAWREYTSWGSTDFPTVAGLISCYQEAYMRNNERMNKLYKRLAQARKRIEELERQQREDPDQFRGSPEIYLSQARMHLRDVEREIERATSGRKACYVDIDALEREQRQEVERVRREIADA